MNAARLTIIALSMAAIIFGGCSTKNGILGPTTGSQSGPAVNQANNVPAGSDESIPESKLFTVIGQVQRTDIENGCFYLEANDGKVYTPVTPKDLNLEFGLKLKAEGYIDEKINLFCGNGPAFVIESYSILGRPNIPGENNDSAVITEKGLSEDKFAPLAIDHKRSDENSGSNTLEGIVKITKEGCLVLSTIYNEEFVLQHDLDILLKTGDRVRVTGFVSVLPYITCYEAPVFVVDRLSVLRYSKKQEKYYQSDNEVTSIVNENDADRELTLTEDRASKKQSGEIDEERSKKSEEEGNDQDGSSERP